MDGSKGARQDETCTPWMLTVRGAGGLPLAAITPATGSQAESIAFYHHDLLGSTVASTQTGSAGPAEVYAYSEFGEPSGGSFLPYRYAGYRYDQETGLYFVQARYYSPALGRFLQPDPIGVAGGANLYVYVGNDPICMVDPSGLTADGPVQKTINFVENAVVNPTMANFAAGAGGVLSLGITNVVNNMTDASSVVDPNSTAYHAGQVTGISIALAGGGAMAGTAGGGASVASEPGATTTAETPPPGTFSTWDSSITNPGSTYVNVGTSATASEMQANLTANGYSVVTQTTGPNGPVTVMSNGTITYAFYTATSTGTTSVQVTGPGVTPVKIRPGQ